MGTKRGLKRNGLELTPSDVFLSHLHLLTLLPGGSYLALLPSFCQVVFEHLPRGPEAGAGGTMGKENKHHPSYTNTYEVAGGKERPLEGL